VLLKEFTPKAEAKNISIDFKPESEPKISVDEVWFYQIIDNLLLNAVKYSPQGTTVQVRIYEDAGNAFISVHDQGPGISDEDRTKLFHRFAKLSARPTGGENSTGLGLSTVKKLVEKMNGSVWCESGTEVGAVFILQFPLC
jgi:signal transduction histidine kinase